MFFRETNQIANCSELVLPNPFLKFGFSVRRPGRAWSHKENIGSQYFCYSDNMFSSEFNLQHYIISLSKAEVSASGI